MTGIALDVGMNTRGAQDGLAQLNRSLANLVLASDRAGRSLGNIGGAGSASMKGMDSNVKSVNSGLSKMQGLLVGVAAGFIGLKAGSSVVAVSDDLINIQNRLKLVSKTAQEVKSTQDKLYKMSQETYSDVGSGTNLYVDFAQALEKKGVSNSRVIGIVKTLQQGAALSGTGAQEAKAGLTQLTQAVSSDLFAGDELKSVQENLKYVSKGFQEQLGKTAGEIKKMGAAGVFNNDMLVKSLEGMAEKTNKDFTSSAFTVEASVTRMVAAFKYGAGVLSQDFNLTKGLLKRVNAMTSGINNAVDNILDKVEQTAIKKYSLLVDKLSSRTIVFTVKAILKSDLSLYDILQIYNDVESVKAVADKLKIVTNMMTAIKEMKRESASITAGDNAEYGDQLAISERLRRQFMHIFRSPGRNKSAVAREGIRDAQATIRKRDGKEPLKDDKLSGPEVYQRFKDEAGERLRSMLPIMALRIRSEFIKKEFEVRFAHRASSITQSIYSISRSINSFNEAASLWQVRDTTLQRGFTNLITSKDMPEAIANLDKLSDAIWTGDWSGLAPKVNAVSWAFGKLLARVHQTKREFTGDTELLSGASFNQAGADMDIARLTSTASMAYTQVIGPVLHSVLARPLSEVKSMLSATFGNILQVLYSRVGYYIGTALSYAIFKLPAVAIKFVYNLDERAAEGPIKMFIGGLYHTALRFTQGLFSQFDMQGLVDGTLTLLYSAWTNLKRIPLPKISMGWALSILDTLEIPHGALDKFIVVLQDSFNIVSETLKGFIPNISLPDIDVVQRFIKSLTGLFKDFTLPDTARLQAFKESLVEIGSNLKTPDYADYIAAVKGFIASISKLSETTIVSDMFSIDMSWADELKSELSKFRLPNLDSINNVLVALADVFDMSPLAGGFNELADSIGNVVSMFQLPSWDKLSEAIGGIFKKLSLGSKTKGLLDDLGIPHETLDKLGESIDLIAKAYKNREQLMERVKFIYDGAGEFKYSGLKNLPRDLAARATVKTIDYAISVGIDVPYAKTYKFIKLVRETVDSVKELTEKVKGFFMFDRKGIDFSIKMPKMSSLKAVAKDIDETLNTSHPKGLDLRKVVAGITVAITALMSPLLAFQALVVLAVNSLANSLYVIGDSVSDVIDKVIDGIDSSSIKGLFERLRQGVVDGLYGLSSLLGKSVILESIAETIKGSNKGGLAEVIRSTIATAIAIAVGGAYPFIAYLTITGIVLKNVGNSGLSKYFDTLMTEVGKVAEKVAEIVTRAVVLGINGLVTLTPALLKGVIEGIIGSTFGAAQSSAVGLLVSNNLINALAIGLLGYVAFAKKGFKTVKKLFSSLATIPAPAMGTGMGARVFFNNKLLAVAAAAAMSTAMMDSISIFEASFVAAPLLLFAILGKDGGLHAIKVAALGLAGAFNSVFSIARPLVMATPLGMSASALLTSTGLGSSLPTSPAYQAAIARLHASRLALQSTAMSGYKNFVRNSVSNGGQFGAVGSTMTAKQALQTNANGTILPIRPVLNEAIASLKAAPLDKAGASLGASGLVISTAFNGMVASIRGLGPGFSAAISAIGVPLTWLQRKVGMFNVALQSIGSGVPKGVHGLVSVFQIVALSIGRHLGRIALEYVRFIDLLASPIKSAVAFLGPQWTKWILGAIVAIGMLALSIKDAKAGTNELLSTKSTSMSDGLSGLTIGMLGFATAIGVAKLAYSGLVKHQLTTPSLMFKLARIDGRAGATGVKDRLALGIGEVLARVTPMHADRLRLPSIISNSKLPGTAFLRSSVWWGNALRSNRSMNIRDSIGKNYDYAKEFLRDQQRVGNAYVPGSSFATRRSALKDYAPERLARTAKIRQALLQEFNSVGADAVHVSQRLGTREMGSKTGRTLLKGLPGFDFNFFKGEAAEKGTKFFHSAAAGLMSMNLSSLKLGATWSMLASKMALLKVGFVGLILSLGLMGASAVKESFWDKHNNLRETKTEVEGLTSGFVALGVAMLAIPSIFKAITAYSKGMVFTDVAKASSAQSIINTQKGNILNNKLGLSKGLLGKSPALLAAERLQYISFGKQMIANVPATIYPGMSARLLTRASPTKQVLRTLKDIAQGNLNTSIPSLPPIAGYRVLPKEQRQAIRDKRAALYERYGRSYYDVRSVVPPIKVDRVALLKAQYDLWKAQNTRVTPTILRANTQRLKDEAARAISVLPGNIQPRASSALAGVNSKLSTLRAAPFSSFTEFQKQQRSIESLTKARSKLEALVARPLSVSNIAQVASINAQLARDIASQPGTFNAGVRAMRESMLGLGSAAKVSIASFAKGMFTVPFWANLLKQVTMFRASLAIGAIFLAVKISSTDTVRESIRELSSSATTLIGILAGVTAAIGVMYLALRAPTNGLGFFSSLTKLLGEFIKLAWIAAKSPLWLAGKVNSYVNPYSAASKAKMAATGAAGMKGLAVDAAGKAVLNTTPLVAPMGAFQAGVQTFVKGVAKWGMIGAGVAVLAVVYQSMKGDSDGIAMNIGKVWDGLRSILDMKATTVGGRMSVMRDNLSPMNVGNTRVDFSAQLRKIDFGKMSQEKFNSFEDVAKEHRGSLDSLVKLAMKQGSLTAEQETELAKTTKMVEDLLSRNSNTAGMSIADIADNGRDKLTSVNNNTWTALQRMLGQDSSIGPITSKRFNEKQIEQIKVDNSKGFMEKTGDHIVKVWSDKFTVAAGEWGYKELSKGQLGSAQLVSTIAKLSNSNASYLRPEDQTKRETLVAGIYDAKAYANEHRSDAGGYEAQVAYLKALEENLPLLNELNRKAEDLKNISVFDKGFKDTLGKLKDSFKIDLVDESKVNMFPASTADIKQLDVLLAKADEIKGRVLRTTSERVTAAQDMNASLEGATAKVAEIKAKISESSLLAFQITILPPSVGATEDYLRLLKSYSEAKSIELTASVDTLSQAKIDYNAISPNAPRAERKLGQDKVDRAAYNAVIASPTLPQFEDINAKGAAVNMEAITASQFDSFNEKGLVEYSVQLDKVRSSFATIGAMKNKLGEPDYFNNMKLSVEAYNKELAKSAALLAKAALERAKEDKGSLAGQSIRLAADLKVELNTTDYAGFIPLAQEVLRLQSALADLKSNVGRTSDVFKNTDAAKVADQTLESRPTALVESFTVSAKSLFPKNELIDAFSQAMKENATDNSTLSEKIKSVTTASGASDLDLTTKREVADADARGEAQKGYRGLSKSLSDLRTGSDKLLSKYINPVTFGLSKIPDSVLDFVNIKPKYATNYNPLDSRGEFKTTPVQGTLGDIAKSETLYTSLFDFKAQFKEATRDKGSLFYNSPKGNYDKIVARGFAVMEASRESYRDILNAVPNDYTEASRDKTRERPNSNLVEVVSNSLSKFDTAKAGLMLDSFIASAKETGDSIAAALKPEHPLTFAERTGKFAPLSQGAQLNNGIDRRVKPALMDSVVGTFNNGGERSPTMDPYYKMKDYSKSLIDIPSLDKAPIDIGSTLASELVKGDIFNVKKDLASLDTDFSKVLESQVSDAVKATSAVVEMSSVPLNDIDSDKYAKVTLELANAKANLDAFNVAAKTTKELLGESLKLFPSLNDEQRKELVGLYTQKESNRQVLENLSKYNTPEGLKTVAVAVESEKDVNVKLGAINKAGTNQSQTTALSTGSDLTKYTAYNALTGGTGSDSLMNNPAKLADAVKTLTQITAINTSLKDIGLPDSKKVELFSSLTSLKEHLAGLEEPSKRLKDLFGGSLASLLGATPQAFKRMKVLGEDLAKLKLSLETATGKEAQGIRAKIVSKEGEVSSINRVSDTQGKLQAYTGGTAAEQYQRSLTLDVSPASNEALSKAGGLEKHNSLQKAMLTKKLELESAPTVRGYQQLGAMERALNTVSEKAKTLQETLSATGVAMEDLRGISASSFKTLMSLGQSTMFVDKQLSELDASASQSTFDTLMKRKDDNVKIAFEVMMQAIHNTPEKISKALAEFGVTSSSVMASLSQGAVDSLLKVDSNIKRLQEALKDPDNASRFQEIYGWLAKSEKIAKNIKDNFATNSGKVEAINKAFSTNLTVDSAIGMKPEQFEGFYQKALAKNNQVEANDSYVSNTGEIPNLAVPDSLFKTALADTNEILKSIDANTKVMVPTSIDSATVETNAAVNGVKVQDSLPSTDSRTSSVMTKFMEMGWTKNQSAGITANLIAESGLKDSIISGIKKGDSGASIGAGQWQPPRQRDFKRVFGEDLLGSSLIKQLQFVNWELNNTEKSAGDRLRRTDSAKGAGRVLSKYYERPLAVSEAMDNRGELASRIVKEPFTSVKQQVEEMLPKVHTVIPAQANDDTYKPSLQVVPPKAQEAVVATDKVADSRTQAEITLASIKGASISTLIADITAMVPSLDMYKESLKTLSTKSLEAAAGVAAQIKDVQNQVDIKAITAEAGKAQVDAFTDGLVASLGVDKLGEGLARIGESADSVAINLLSETERVFAEGLVKSIGQLKDKMNLTNDPKVKRALQIQLTKKQEDLKNTLDTEGKDPEAEARAAGKSFSSNILGTFSSSLQDYATTDKSFKEVATEGLNKMKTTFFSHVLDGLMNTIAGKGSVIETALQGLGSITSGKGGLGLSSEGSPSTGVFSNIFGSIGSVVGGWFGSSEAGVALGSGIGGMGDKALGVDTNAPIEIDTSSVEGILASIAKLLQQTNTLLGASGPSTVSSTNPTGGMLGGLASAGIAALSSTTLLKDYAGNTGTDNEMLGLQAGTNSVLKPGGAGSSSYIGDMTANEALSSGAINGISGLAGSLGSLFAKGGSAGPAAIPQGSSVLQMLTTIANLIQQTNTLIGNSAGGGKSSKTGGAVKTGLSLVGTAVGTYFGSPQLGKMAGDTLGSFADGALKKAAGGPIVGPGTGTSDSVPAMLSTGEFVVNAKDAMENQGLLHAINSGRTHHLATGGQITKTGVQSSYREAVSSKSASNSPISNSQTINLKVVGDVSRQTKSEIFKMMPIIASGVNIHNREKGFG
jgi:tape measure domain-containing protein